MGDRRAAIVGGLLLVASVLVGCSADGDQQSAAGHVALDGSPRVPDDAGVVTAIDADFATLTLDGEHVYEIADDVQSFASIDGSTQPLRARLGQYVHVGLEGDTVVWVGNIGSVLRLEDQPETVVYLAAISDVVGDQLWLRDGTVFTLADGVTVPDPDEQPYPAVLHVDVASDLVVAVDLSE